MAAETTPEVDAISQVSFVVLDILTRCAAELDLSVTQLRLLGILRDREPTMAQLAIHLGLDRSSVSGLIDRAERRALVARRTSRTDARVTLVALTHEGRRVAADLAASVSAQLESLLAPLGSPATAHLTELLESVMSAHRELPPTAPVAAPRGP